MPVEKLLGWLPDPIQGQIDRVAEPMRCRMALRVAVKTMDDETREAPWNLSHKVAATMSGVTGGMFGAPALFAELPVTTVIIMRSIADIARSKGEDLSDPRVRLACLEVFALGSGGKQAPADAAEEMRQGARAEEGYVRTTYFLARAAMAQQVTAAAEVLSRGAGGGRRVGADATHRQDCVAVRHCREREGGGAGRAGRGGDRRRAHQRTVHGSLPEHGRGPLYGAEAGTGVRGRGREAGVRADCREEMSGE